MYCVRHQLRNKDAIRVSMSFVSLGSRQRFVFHVQMCRHLEDSAFSGHVHVQLSTRLQ